MYFAGEHLSHHHTWIAGALESAWETVADVIGSTAQLGPLGLAVPVEVDSLEGIELPSVSVPVSPSDVSDDDDDDDDDDEVDNAALIDARGWEQAGQVGDLLFGTTREQAIGFNTQWSSGHASLNSALLYPLTRLGIEQPMRLGVEHALLQGAYVGSV